MISKIYKIYNINKNLRHTLYTYDHVNIISNARAHRIVETMKKKDITPYTHWICVYDPEIIDDDGYPAILESLNAEEWLVQHFGTPELEKVKGGK
jgi:hypothetical protein